MSVSIHAPTRGATHAALNTFVGALVSIHAPTRGATDNGFSVCPHNDSFNPRPHKGGDNGHRVKDRDDDGFNPRPHKGGDMESAEHSPTLRVSIHAPTRGATLGAGDVGAYTKFQSTPPQGGRHELKDHPDKSIRVSIHAPTRGATCMYTKQNRHYFVSIHAPTRGATM